MPILIGAAIIAAAILLSTLITAVGTRFVGMEGPTEETVWLIDRLTGNVYKCQAPEHGKASCETGYRDREHRGNAASGSAARSRRRIFEQSTPPHWRESGYIPAAMPRTQSHLIL